jgi:hypothetical protein
LVEEVKMMKILPDRRADSFEKATILAFQEAGKGDLSPDVATVFASAIDSEKISVEAERTINTTVHGRYGRSARWHGQPWLIPLPQPRYDVQPIPRITFSVQGYLVAPIMVKTTGDSYRATVVGPVGKPERLILPIPFLQAILDDDLGQFELVGRDGRYTSWNVPGLTEALRLPDDFVTCLSAVLRLKSAVSWLLGFGSAGKAIAPLTAGSLLGLQFHGLTRPLSVGEQSFQREVVIDTLTRMFGSARAAEMFEKSAPYLKSSMSNEEAVSLIIKEAGRMY